MKTGIVKKHSTLPESVRRRIFSAYSDLEVSERRINHVKIVTKSLMHLRAGHFARFHDKLLPVNRQYEDRESYLDKVKWLQDLLFELDPRQQQLLELGIRLHDIGYAITPSGDHNEKGAQLLIGEVMGEQGQKARKLFESLGLNEDERFRVISMVLYHGLFNDIGYLYDSKFVDYFDPSLKKKLAILSCLDNTAKTYGLGYHNMMFSRLIERCKRIISEDTHILPHNRLRQLFGPLGYVWLKKDDLQYLEKSFSESGVSTSYGYESILSRTYFYCWPLLKDLVSDTVAYASEYYTPFNREHASDFAGFMRVLSQVVETIENPGPIFVETGFNYFNFTNRPPFLSFLRDLARSGADLQYFDYGVYSCKGLVFDVSRIGFMNFITMSFKPE